MADNVLTLRYGRSIESPSPDDLHAALAEMDAHDPEHPDCSLSNFDCNWTVSVYSSGLVIIEDPEEENDPPGPFHLRVATPQDAYPIWIELSEDRTTDLFSRPWHPGMGR